MLCCVLPLLLSSFPTVVSSPWNRWPSPAPEVSHGDAGRCRMSSEKILLCFAVENSETKPSAVVSQPRRRKTRKQGQCSRVWNALSPLSLHYNWHKCLVRPRPQAPPQCHGIHLSKNNETYCALDMSGDVFSWMKPPRPIQRPDEAFFISSCCPACFGRRASLHIIITFHPIKLIRFGEKL